MNRAERRRQQKLAGKTASRTPDGPRPHRETPLLNVLNEAVRHHGAGRLNEARQGYQAVLQAEPQNPVALHLLGVIAHQTGDNPAALELIAKAIAAKPDYAEAHLNHGIVQKALGRTDQAVQSFASALRLNPELAEAHNQLGIVSRDRARLDDACAAFRKAVALNTGHAEAYNNLGNTLRDLGRLQDAARTYRQAIAHAPDHPLAYRHLAMVENCADNPQDVEAMQNAYAHSAPKSEARMFLAFALGKAREDLADYEGAFACYQEANAIHRARFTYDVRTEEQTFARVRDAFDAGLFERLAGRGHPVETPVFIVGLPRSGTTLVEQMLASHPGIHGAGELNIFPRLVASAFGAGGRMDYPPPANALEQADYARLGRTYAAALRDLSPASARITDKLPDNHRFLGLIKLALPRAKVIHCRRGLADTGLSLYKNYFPAQGHWYAYDLDELGRFLKAYGSMMDHWHAVLPGFIHDVRYEDLVADTETELRRLLDFCGLDWRPECLNFHTTERPVRTASAEQVRRPIYTSSVQAWKRYERQLEPMLKHLR